MKTLTSQWYYEKTKIGYKYIALGIQCFDQITGFPIALDWTFVADPKDHNYNYVNEIELQA